MQDSATIPELLHTRIPEEQEEQEQEQYTGLVGWDDSLEPQC